MKTLMEFELRANLGCCFSMFDETENDLMWRSYAPAEECGVLIVIRAGALREAVAASTTGQVFLARVKYVSDKRAQNVRVVGSRSIYFRFMFR